VSAPHAIIFDFDGVIVESADIKTRAFEALYVEHGAQVVEAALAHHKANGGISRRQKIRHVHRAHLGQTLDRPALDALCARFSDLVEDAVANCEWVPGAREFLDSQHGRLPMFVCSGTPHEELLRIVARRGIEDRFERIFGSPPEKPPTIRDILREGGWQACQVLFVGDAMTDYRAAQETGVRFVGRVPDGGEDPFPAGTDVICDLAALPGMLSRAA
jgi:phosphoglycolate phosphatase-like HAD superfamily hydrolase